MSTAQGTTSTSTRPAGGVPAVYSALVGLASLGVLLQALWAGLFVHEGEEYEQKWVHVHAIGADVTIVLAIAAAIVAVARLRSSHPALVNGTAALAVLLVLEAYLGGLIGEHSGLTAVHFPLAMALMALAVWLPLRARSRG